MKTSATTNEKTRSIRMCGTEREFFVGVSFCNHPPYFSKNMDFSDFPF